MNEAQEDGDHRAQKQKDNAESNFINRQQHRRLQMKSSLAFQQYAGRL
jgi:hypothetical protein